MTTAAQRLYMLPETVQDSLCDLVDTVAGMDAGEKYAALVQLDQTARGLVALGSEESAPTVQVALATRNFVTAMAVEAAPAHIKEGAA